MENERISTIRSSIIFRRASLQFSCFVRFLFLEIMILSSFLFYFRSIQEDPGSLQGPPRICRDHFGGILWWSDFSRNPKIMNIDFPVFPVTVFDGTRPIRLVWFPGVLCRPPSQPKIIVISAGSNRMQGWESENHKKAKRNSHFKKL